VTYSRLRSLRWVAAQRCNGALELRAAIVGEGGLAQSPQARAAFGFANQVRGEGR
jgi:hypothetical protein